MRIIYILIVTAIFSAGLVTTASAQRGAFDRIRGMGNSFGGGGGRADSIAHRTGLEDSITINFRFLDSTRMRGFDSTIYDFTKKVPLPWYHINLGNFGNASRSLLFTPIMQAGWDHGFHVYDNYNFTVGETRFFNTTRPYTEMNYLLGSRSEQMINIIHTQNVKPNWNMGIQYRLINSPGTFQNSNSNHNSYRFSSWYQSKNKRYQNFVIFVGNKLQSGENGGIRSDRFLDSTGYDERFSIPTQLGEEQVNSRNFFTTNIGTGAFFTTSTFLMRQQYDLGQKDSIVTDSTVIPLFYPRLRLEHTINYSTYKYRFRDNAVLDSAWYKNNYGIDVIAPRDTFFAQDHWKELINDFSIYQFPDAKNAQQFIKVGASMQVLAGAFDLPPSKRIVSTIVFLQTMDGMRKSGRTVANEHNFFLHGEYRNKTRNQKWDIAANGQFYVNGLNAGDYNAYISLQRYISKKIGYLQVGFHNVNRTPSFVFKPASSFYLPSADTLSFNKENITNIFATLDQPQYKLKLSGNYYLVTNLAYFSSRIQPSQESALFNLLRITAEKHFSLGKRGWNWKTWIILQQRAGDGPVNVPLLTTRNTIGYDGNLGFKNLNISFGLEGRYFTAYKAPAYSPLIGQYYFQDTTTVKLRMPELSLYMHFRIKTFNAYIRGENLNTLSPQGGFTNNNIPTIGYPYPGLQIRVGIFWTFIN